MPSSAPATPAGPVLVTGAAGFVGSHVVDALLAAGRPVRALDLLHPGAHAGPPAYLDPAAEWTFADLRDPAALAACLDGAQAVSHQASMVGLGESFSDVEDYVAHNDAATAALLRALDRARFRGRLVLAGSMAVYGEGRWTCARDGVVAPQPRAPDDLARGRFDPACPRCGAPLQPSPVPENAPADPRSVYAATKLHQEHLCAAYARECGASLTVLRYHNVYGPRMPRDTPYAGVASLFRSALERAEAPRVFEDGAQRRDFVHVRDVAAANLAALDPATAPGTYNVASGRPDTVLEMARALARAAGPDAPPPVVTGEWRLGDVRHVFARTDRAERELGFRAQISLPDGMRELARAELREPVDAATAR